MNFSIIAGFAVIRFYISAIAFGFVFCIPLVLSPTG